jgi:hypothetical protein
MGGYDPPMLIIVFGLCAAPARALTLPTSGPGVDIGAGLAVASGPLAARLGLAGSAGWWFGHYDDQYALGRYWWVGPTVRVDLLPQVESVATLVELRRGTDLVVAGVAPLVAAGPIWVDGQLGGAARVGVIAEFRRTRYHGVTLRLEAGANIGADVQFSGSALVGWAFSRPL